MTGKGTQDASVLKAAVANVLSPTQSLQAAELQSTRVLLRADLNCPLNKDKSVSDESRITGALPTIQLLQSKGARIVLVSHLGRPSPKSQTLAEMKERYSLRPVAERLSFLLGPSFVGLVDDCVGDAVQAAVAKLEDGQVCH
jgi:phosphoglycerate kinase